MSDLISLVGVDGGNRAFHVDDIRLLEDEIQYEDSDGVLHDRAKVTLCDGTQLMVNGSVASILKIIEQLES